MAISPKDVYPGQVDVTNLVQYPQGKAQNDLVEGDGFGSPLEQTWVNDVWGFLQALLAKAGIVPSGTPDNATTSQYVDAVKFVAQSAHNVYFAKNYGAVGDGVATDHTALQAAIVACATAGGGTVILSPGTYKIATVIYMSHGVSLCAAGPVTITTSHPTQDILLWGSGTNAGAAQRISGINFESTIANTGSLFKVLAGVNADVIVENCRFNKAATNLKGHVFWQVGDSNFTFADCVANCGTMTFGWASNGGILALERVTISVSSGYADTLIVNQTTGDVVVRDCTITTTSSASACSCVYIGASVRGRIQGNAFQGTILQEAIKFADGATVHADDNVFSGIIPYGTYAPTDQAGLGSYLGEGPQLVISSSAATVTVPRYATAVYIESTRTTPPTVAFGVPLCPQQSCVFRIKNASIADWTTPLGFTGTDYYGTTQIDDIPQTGWLSTNFAAIKGSGAAFWTQLCGWARNPL